MKKAAAGVRWVGRAATPALAVACPTCNVAICQACSGKVFPLPHLEREVRAEALGFVAVKPPGGIFAAADR